MITYSGIILSTTGIVSYWPLNEKGGTTAYDLAGSNSGTYHGSYKLFQNGPSGNPAVSFDGNSAYVEVPSTPSLHPTGAITMEAWVLAPSSLSSYQEIMGCAFSGNFAPFVDYSLYQDNANKFYSTVGVGIVEQDSPHFAFQTNSWYYLAGTCDGAIQNFYINGVLKSSTIVSGAINNSNQPFDIARSNRAGTIANYFFGYICNVALYNVALSSGTVYNHYISIPDFTINNARINQIGYEFIGQSIANERVAQVGFETINQSVANDRLNQIGFETINQSIANARVNQVGYEVIYLNPLIPSLLTSNVDAAADLNIITGLFSKRPLNIDASVDLNSTSQGVLLSPISITNKSHKTTLVNAGFFSNSFISTKFNAPAHFNPKKVTIISTSEPLGSQADINLVGARSRLSAAVVDSSESVKFASGKISYFKAYMDASVDIGAAAICPKGFTGQISTNCDSYLQGIRLSSLGNIVGNFSVDTTFNGVLNSPFILVDVNVDLSADLSVLGILSTASQILDINADLAGDVSLRGIKLSQLSTIFSTNIDTVYAGIRATPNNIAVDNSNDIVIQSVCLRSFNASVDCLFSGNVNGGRISPLYCAVDGLSVDLGLAGIKAISPNFGVAENFDVNLAGIRLSQIPLTYTNTADVNVVGSRFAVGMTVVDASVDVVIRGSLISGITLHLDADGLLIVRSAVSFGEVLPTLNFIVTAVNAIGFNLSDVNRINFIVDVDDMNFIVY